MTGRESENEMWQKRIKNKIEKYKKEMPYLETFNNYIGKKSLITRYNYLNHVVNFLKYTNKDVSELNISDYINYMGSLEDKTSSYHIITYSALKKFSKFLNATKLNAENPMIDVEAPERIESLETSNKRENGYLTKEECKQYIDNVKNCNTGMKKIHEGNMKRDLALIMLLLNTGMRCSALRTLDVDSLDLEKNTLRTVEKERRVVEIPFSNEIKNVLVDWLKEREKILDGIDEPALFISNRKNRMSNTAVTKTVEKYAHTIDKKHITPHKLRATYGTNLYNTTHDLYFVQQCMGHASPDITETYIRGQKDVTRRQASEIMEDFLW